jgi:hypothetical protein
VPGAIGRWLTKLATGASWAQRETDLLTGVQKTLRRLEKVAELTVRRTLAAADGLDADDALETAAAWERLGLPRRPLRRSRLSNYGWRKMSWVPTRRHFTCGSPGRRSGPYSKVARPSGAHVISQTPGQLWTLFTRKPGRNARPAFKSATIADTAARKRRCC